MKKKIIISLFVLAVLTIGFTPFNQQKTITIRAHYFITMEQLLKPNDWEKWQPDINQAWKKDPSQIQIVKKNASFTIQNSGLVLKVDNINGFGFNVEKTINGSSSSYGFIAVPDNKKGTTLITLVQKSSLFNYLKGCLSNSSSKNDIDYLKSYLEDSRLYYGFDIKKTTVIDSNVVVIKKAIPKQNKLIEIAQILQDLRSFIKQHNLKIVQPVIADIRKADNDSLRMMIGLPINQQTVSAGKVKFMHLPQHGRMLTGNYTGRYSDREKLYIAMKTYLTDHNLASPEDPYEKYLDNKIPANDSSLVHLQVNFPIY